ncbi:MAG: hypothetical protein K2G50_01975 [Anaeroplasmataceae bacterium]|nr:hypothetical protein [Anaeroplasmataceae bacterium]
MAFWNKKKLDSRLITYFVNHKIPYEIVNEESTQIQFELCLAEKKMMIYPYLSMKDDMISFNVNVTEHVLKGYDYESLNQFNLKSPFFKAMITEKGIIVLEYRFVNEDIEIMMDQLIESIFSLQEEIDAL